MERVVKFLKDAETYYLATVEGDQPREGCIKAATCQSKGRNMRI